MITLKEFLEDDPDRIFQYYNGKSRLYTGQGLVYRLEADGNDDLYEYVIRIRNHIFVDDNDYSCRKTGIEISQEQIVDLNAPSC